jgi:hypothetical protein
VNTFSVTSFDDQSKYSEFTTRVLYKFSEGKLNVMFEFNSSYTTENNGGGE